MRIKNKTNTNLKWAIAITILVVLIGGGITYAITQKNSPQNTPEATKPVSKSAQSDDTPTDPEDANPKHNDVATENLPDTVDKDKVKAYVTLVENEKYKIRKLDNKYVVTLYAIINNPSQYDAYQEQLRTYKKEALEYLTRNNVNTNTADITYEPQEATNL